MADNPRVAYVTTSPASVVWSNGATFDGYLLFTLSGNPALRNTDQFLNIPKYTKVPIIAGVVDPNTGLYFNADLNPTNLTYTTKVYDVFDNEIATIAGGPFLISAPTTTITIPTLTPV